jgi:hypothetical protein
MRFDIEDIGNYFKNTVRHEMGHVSSSFSHLLADSDNLIKVFGLGSLWEERKLVTPDGVVPVSYVGLNGNLGHKEIGGAGDMAAVETLGGQGTARSQ